MALTYAVSPSSSGFSPAFCVKRCRLNNEIGAMLGTQLDAQKAAGRPVRLVRSRCKVPKPQSYYLRN
ncbi:MAG: hypothetical protein KME31_11270 [Tolypothrix carrinoi HA7290-LM1]|nr:hypothetical protein [Tolypothrix carrinoi HA7290-LM1]